MNSYLSVLPAGSTAVAVKTKGHNFFIDDEGGLSSTGCWVIDKDKTYDYIIVFHETEKGNDIYIGSYVGKSAEEYTERQGKRYPRYRLFIRDIKFAGQTPVNWTTFVGKSSGGFERIYLENPGAKTEEFYDPNSKEADEGYRRDSIFMTSSRDRKLAQARKLKDDFTCQACGNQYLFNNKYVIDCHHLNPISLGTRKTKIEDLVSLCPTCHRVAHTKAPPFDINELKELIKDPSKFKKQTFLLP